MTEPTPETGTETPPPTEPETGKSEPDWKAEAEKWKALSRKNEERFKALESRDPVKDLLAKLGATPEQGQDAQSALQDRMTAMERRAADAELKAVRLEVAAAKGLTPAQAARLQGNTAEELLADADQLLSLFPASAQPTPGATGPKPDPTQGSRGTGAPGMLSAADVRRLAAEGKHAEITKAQQEGRIDYESARRQR